MNKLSGALLAIVATLFLSPKAHGAATDVYITPDGSGQGACTTNPQSPTWFNSSSNWGSTTSQIGPGTTVHLCGTFTGAAGSTLLSFHGSGTSGNPITLQWDTDAILQAPYFSASNYGINGNGAAYVVLDGGSNGIIQNTANGTGMANAQGSVMIGGFGSNFQVKNLSILNVYVHTSGDTGGGGSWGIRLDGQSNAIVGPGNTITQCDVGVFDDWSAAGNSNLTIYNNTFGNNNQDIEAGFYPAGTFTNVYIYGNASTNWSNWDNSSNTFHHNFVHLFTNMSGAVLAGDLQIYNNKIAGDMGSHATSLLYLENNNGGTGGTISAIPYIFNNVLYKTNANVPTSTGIVAMLGVSNGYILNNTIIDAGGTGSDAYNCINIYQSGWTVQNNIFEGCGSYIYQQSSGITASNNDYYGAASPQWIYMSNYASTLAGWQKACSCDASSLSINPSLTSSYLPASSSKVIGAGVNLTNLAVKALDSDAAGIARPATGSWDIGAFSYGVRPDPPTSTTTTVNKN